jgi:hypothetical protein
MNVDVLDRDLLLPFAAITLERLDLSSEGAQQLHCEVSVSFPREQRLSILGASTPMLTAFFVISGFIAGAGGVAAVVVAVAMSVFFVTIRPMA